MTRLRISMSICALIAFQGCSAVIENTRSNNQDAAATLDVIAAENGMKEEIQGIGLTDEMARELGLGFSNVYVNSCWKVSVEGREPRVHCLSYAVSGECLNAEDILGSDQLSDALALSDSFQSYLAANLPTWGYTFEYQNGVFRKQSAGVEILLFQNIVAERSCRTQEVQEMFAYDLLDENNDNIITAEEALDATCELRELFGKEGTRYDLNYDGGVSIFDFSILNHVIAEKMDIQERQVLSVMAMADVNSDRMIDQQEKQALIDGYRESFGRLGTPYDFNQDGGVSVFDFSLISEALRRIGIAE